jgi:excisionase family DNA binding protein
MSIEVVCPRPILLSQPRGDRARAQCSPYASVSLVPDDLPLLLTVDETASLLRTTKSAIYAMVERGQLPGVTRLGRRVLVRSDALLRWLDQKSAPSPDIRTIHPAVKNLTRLDHARNQKPPK